MMDPRSQKRLIQGILFFVFVLICLCLFPVYTLLEKVKPYREWRVRQTRAMTENTQMRIEGSYRISGNGYTVFRIWSRWLGEDLHENYDLTAALSNDGKFDGKPQAFWYVWLPSGFQKKEGTFFMWGFHAPPDSTKRVWMRVYYRPKKSKEEPRWVDFEFPYFPATDDQPPAGSI